MRKWFDRPMWFDGGQGQAQILIVEDDHYAYAWVGQRRRGMLVSFDTEDFQAFRLDEPGAAFATAAAIGWYIDLCVTVRRSSTGTATVTRIKKGTKTTGAAYRPTAAWRHQHQSVVKGVRRPPRPHIVAAFIRRVPQGQNPNPAHVMAAPKRLRARMGRRDTWVRAHLRGGSQVTDWPIELSKYSALADILAAMATRARPKISS
jgi:hypothetical protein